MELGHFHKPQGQSVAVQHLEQWENNIFGCWRVLIHTLTMVGMKHLELSLHSTLQAYQVCSQGFDAHSTSADSWTDGNIWIVLGSIRRFNFLVNSRVTLLEDPHPKYSLPKTIRLDASSEKWAARLSEIAFAEGCMMGEGWFSTCWAFN